MPPVDEIPDDLGTGQNRPLYKPQDLDSLANLILRIAGQGGAGRLARIGAERLNFINKSFSTKAQAVQVLPVNSKRNYLFIQNNSITDMFVGFGSRPNATTGVKLTAGSFYEPFRAPVSSVYIFCAVVGSNGVVVEG